MRFQNPEASGPTGLAISIALDEGSSGVLTLRQLSVLERMLYLSIFVLRSKRAVANAQGEQRQPQEAPNYPVPFPPPFTIRLPPEADPSPMQPI